MLTCNYSSRSNTLPEKWISSVCCNSYLWPAMGKTLKAQSLLLHEWRSRLIYRNMSRGDTHFVLVKNHHCVIELATYMKKIISLSNAKSCRSFIRKGGCFCPVFYNEIMKSLKSSRFHAIVTTSKSMYQIGKTFQLIVETTTSSPQYFGPVIAALTAF